MTSQHFKDSAKALARAADSKGVVLDIYAILHLTEALIAGGHNFAAPPVTEPLHEVLVNMAMQSHYVKEAVRDNKKIVAIKELRGLAYQYGAIPRGVGGYLATLKRAIEDQRVEAAAALYSNPWENDRSEEPPF